MLDAVNTPPLVTEPPVDSVTDQVTGASVPDATMVVLANGTTEAVEGVTDRLAADTVTVAVAVQAPSATDVATTWYVPGVAGAV